MQNNTQQSKQKITQLERVIYAATEPLTLSQIQQKIKREFGIYDQETSISARIREATTCGYQKRRTPVKNNKTGRVHYLYQLSKAQGQSE